MNSDINLADGSTVSLRPSALDAYAVFEDLCLLANSERPHFLKLEALPKTFALELIESVLTNYHKLFRHVGIFGLVQRMSLSNHLQHPEILLLLHQYLCPLLLKSLSERPFFPFTLRATRVVFILLKQFSLELVTEAEVFLMLLVKIVSGEHDSNGPRPLWMRVLAVEVIRGFVYLSQVNILELRIPLLDFAPTPSLCDHSGTDTMPSRAVPKSSHLLSALSSDSLQKNLLCWG